MSLFLGLTSRNLYLRYEYSWCCHRIWLSLIFCNVLCNILHYIMQHGFEDFYVFSFTLKNWGTHYFYGFLRVTCGSLFQSKDLNFNLVSQCFSTQTVATLWHLSSIQRPKSEERQNAYGISIFVLKKKQRERINLKKPQKPFKYVLILLKLGHLCAQGFKIHGFRTANTKVLGCIS